MASSISRRSVRTEPEYHRTLHGLKASPEGAEPERDHGGEERPGGFVRSWTQPNRIMPTLAPAMAAPGEGQLVGPAPDRCRDEVVGRCQAEEDGGDADPDVEEAVWAGLGLPGGPSGKVEVTVMAKSLASTRMTTAWSPWSPVGPRFQRRRSASRSVVVPDAMVPETCPGDSADVMFETFLLVVLWIGQSSCGGQQWSATHSDRCGCASLDPWGPVAAATNSLFATVRCPVRYNTPGGVMDIDALLNSATDSMTIKRVFGEPIERDGALVIPVAVVAGGGGGGRREAQDDHPGTESGGGFGVWARPIGVYVVRGERVEFRPAIDILPVVLGTAFLMSRLLRAWSRRRK